MKSRFNPRRVLLLAFALAVLTVILVYHYLQTAAVSAQAVPMTTVVVATQDIPPYVTITSGMVGVRSFPENYVVPGALGQVGLVVGAVTKEPVSKGDPVLFSDLYKPGQYGAGLQFLVPKGQRALTVSIDALNSFSGMLEVGDHVDLIAILPPSLNAPGATVPVVETILQNVKVLALGNQTNPGAVGPQGYTNVTLLMSPTQAQKVILATQSATLRFTLRAAGDKQIPTVPTFNPATNSWMGP